MSESSLAQDLGNFFDNDKVTDVIIRTEPVINAHSQILRARSEYFSRLFSERWAVIENNSYIVNRPNCSYSAMYKIIRFIYSDHIDLTDLDLKTILDSWRK